MPSPSAPPPPPHIVRRILRPRRIAFGVGVLAAAFLGYLGLLQLTGNVHAVIPGELYRSATLPAAELATLVDGQGIRTIVNLRGGSPADAWYREEHALAAAAGIRIVDLAWSDRRALTDAEVRQFFAVIDAAERPLLIHCRAGADRTGLAAALYLAHVAHADEESAEEQLSWRYGHIGTPLSASYPMDATFERLEPLLGYLGS